MPIKLKPLSEQTIVLTGATSGIGLVTARTAARRGAKLALVARNEDALKTLSSEINDGGGESIYIAADVGSEGDMITVVSETLARFGNFDTWINNAGISIYGKLEDVEIEDSRRLFDTNFWGVVNGSVIAARNLRLYGGAIINIGSALSDRAIPLQGMYCASKHAVKGFTDALRMELEADGAPVSVTLIKPSAIDTPSKDHAKNYLEVKPQNPAPVYSPSVVSDAILHCAEHPVRDLFVGAGGKALSAFGNYAPRAADRALERAMLQMQQTDEPAGYNVRESLYESHDAGLSERGGYEGHVSESSLYTQASLHPVVTGTAVAVGVGGLAFALARSLKNREMVH
jgi:short-subunit dehydrogenase